MTTTMMTRLWQRCESGVDGTDNGEDEVGDGDGGINGDDAAAAASAAANNVHKEEEDKG